MTSSPVVRLHEDNREAGGRYGPLSLCPPRPEPTFTVAVRRTPFRAAANLCRLRRVTPSTHHVARPVSDVPRSSARSLARSSFPPFLLPSSEIPFCRRGRPKSSVFPQPPQTRPRGRGRRAGREREQRSVTLTHSRSPCTPCPLRTQACISGRGVTDARLPMS